MSSLTPNLNLVQPDLQGDVGHWDVDWNSNAALLDAAAAIGVTSVSASGTLLLGSNPTNVFEVTTGSSTINLSMPPSPGFKREITIRKADAGSGTVVISNINGTIYELGIQNQFVKAYWNGSGWFQSGSGP